MPELHVVTGAFGYSGKYIAERLLRERHTVLTLTNSPARTNPFAGRVKAFPFNFYDPSRMIQALRGAAVLYNTYWVRFNHRGFKHATAVENTLKLFSAAKEAGVRRVVHVSITNPFEESHLEYFRGKARLERALMESGLPYTILRPAVLFGKEDILINNIAWILRRFPVFGVFGDGNYRLQPIHVDDLARLAVEAGRDTSNRVVNAIGPETYTYRELVNTIGDIIGKHRQIVTIPPWLGLWAGRFIGTIVDDVLITRDEIHGLMEDLLYVNGPPAGETRLSVWARANAATLGVRYASEMARRRNRSLDYGRL